MVNCEWKLRHNYMQGRVNSAILISPDLVGLRSPLGFGTTISGTNRIGHDDVIKWKYFPRNWPFARGIHRSPVDSPHKGQWRGALMFSLIYPWTNSGANNRDAGDLWRHRAHYNVNVILGMTPMELANWLFHGTLIFLAKPHPTHSSPKVQFRLTRVKINTYSSQTKCLFSSATLVVLFWNCLFFSGIVSVACERTCWRTGGRRCRLSLTGDKPLHELTLTSMSDIIWSY